MFGFGFVKLGEGVAPGYPTYLDQTWALGQWRSSLDYCLSPLLPTWTSLWVITAIYLGSSCCKYSRKSPV